MKNLLVLKLLVVYMIMVLVSSSASAQSSRLEIAIRMRALEKAWLENSDAQARKAALPRIEYAVQCFFMLDLAKVCEGFDRASRILAGKKEQPDWANELSIQPNTRLIGDNKQFQLLVKRVYGDSTIPATGKLQILYRLAENSSWTRPEAPKKFRVGEMLSWGLPKVEASDVEFRIRLFDGDRVVREWRDHCSVHLNLEKKLAGLKLKVRQATLSKVKASYSILELSMLSTANALILRAQNIRSGFVPENSVLVVADLARADLLLTTLLAEKAGNAEAKKDFTSAGDHWLVLDSGKHQSQVRCFVPTGIKPGENRPIVIAVHGVGGSENLFFEGYGAGKIVELCKKRGWILLSPNRPLLGAAPLEEILGMAKKLLPVDQERVFMIGHSMGAMQASLMASRFPKLFAGVACLGGGGRIVSSKDLSQVNFFVGAGDRDFGLAGARQLYSKLKGSQAKVLWKVYKNCEHMFIVSEALQDVFKFFDRSLLQKKDSKGS